MEENINISEKVIALDIGGTAVKSAYIDRYGQIANFLTTSIRDCLTRFEIEKKLFGIVSEYLTISKNMGIDVIGLGISTTGEVDNIEGVIRYNMPTLPNWKGYKIKKVFEDQFSLPVIVENDANAAAYAEYKFGAAQGFDSLVLLTLGTGVGGGIILDGKIHRGKNFWAGNVGHIIVLHNSPNVCVCGDKGCLESLFSLNVIQEMVKTRFSELNIGRGDLSEGGNIEILFKFVKMRNRIALSILDELCRILASAILTISSVLDPDVFVIGGGIAEAGEVFFIPLDGILKQRAALRDAPQFKLFPAKLGNKAGVVGAAKLWFDQQEVLQ